MLCDKHLLHDKIFLIKIIKFDSNFLWSSCHIWLIWIKTKFSCIMQDFIKICIVVSEVHVKEVGGQTYLILFMFILCTLFKECIKILYNGIWLQCYSEQFGITASCVLIRTVWSIPATKPAHGLPTADVDAIA